MRLQMSQSTTNKPFPTIEMISSRAGELGMSYGKYCSSPQYTADKNSLWFERHFTRSGKRILQLTAKLESPQNGERKI